MGCPQTQPRHAADHAGHRCAVAGCANRPRYHPVLVLRGEPGGPRSEATLDHAVCRGHKKTLEADDVLTDELWENLAGEFRLRGRPEPVRELTTLRFERIR